MFNISYVEAAQARNQTTNVAPADLMATLVQFSADTIADAIKRVVRTGASYRIADPRVYMSWGRSAQSCTDECYPAAITGLHVWEYK